MLFYNLPQKTRRMGRNPPCSECYLQTSLIPAEGSVDRTLGYAQKFAEAEYL